MTQELAAEAPRKKRTMRPKPQRPLVGREPLAEPAEVATYLKTSEKTLEWWRVKGINLPFVKVGHGVRYDWSDVDDYVRKNKTETETEAAA